MEPSPETQDQARKNDRPTKITERDREREREPDRENGVRKQIVLEADTLKYSKEV